MSALSSLLVRREALLAAFFRRDVRGDFTGADRFMPAIGRVQRVIERHQSAAA